MPASNRKVILYIAATIDGYIAKPDGDISWLLQVDQPGEDYGYGEFIETVDTVIMGRKTYDKIMSLVPEFPHRDKTAYIITRKNLPSKGKLIFYSGNLNELVSKLRNETGKNIYLDGGAEIVNAMLKNNLIDEMIISIVPLLLGDGIRLFNDGRPEQKMKLTDCRKFESGLAQMRYSK